MSETPLFLSYADADITTAELKEYLSEIQKQLTTFRLNKNLIKNV